MAIAPPWVSEPLEDFALPTMALAQSLERLQLVPLVVAAVGYQLVYLILLCMWLHIAIYTSDPAVMPTSYTYVKPNASGYLLYRTYP